MHVCKLLVHGCTISTIMIFVPVKPHVVKPHIVCLKESSAGNPKDFHQFTDVCTENFH